MCVRIVQEFHISKLGLCVIAGSKVPSSVGHANVVSDRFHIHVFTRRTKESLLVVPFLILRQLYIYIYAN